MALIRQATYLAVLVGISSHVWIQTVASSSLAYCANINTASTNANYSKYQSNGLCSDFCLDHSYAILQGTSCWCSDYTPASSATTDIDNCDNPCPGYPADLCGGDGLYGYLFLDQTPVGTKDASSLSTTSKATSTERTTTVQDTVSISPSPTSHSLNSSATGSIATITTGGVVQTVTGAPDGSTIRPSRKGLSTGAAVGIAVGVVVAVLGVSALVLFMWWKKRKEKRAEAADPSPRSSSAGMVSTMASMGEAGQAGTRRGSKFIPIDDRMEFNATLYNRGDGNPSSDSVNSLRDNMDYSRRVLRATNPDPPAQP